MPNEVKLLPCPTCNADYANENPFCSDGFHAKGPLYWPCEHCAGTGNVHARPTIVTDEVVERVARAIDDALPESDRLTIAPSQIKRAARAAIAAMPAIVGGE